MLTGTDLPPDTYGGQNCPAVRESYGRKDRRQRGHGRGFTHSSMPVLIAGTEALLEPGAPGIALAAFQPGPHRAPSGPSMAPIRNDIFVNSSYGVMSPGNIANSTIGRAMGLIIKNIGGVRKGIEDTGCLGNPAKYSTGPRRE